MAKGTRSGIGVFTLLELVARGRDMFGERPFAQRRVASAEFEQFTYRRLYGDVVRMGAALGKSGVAHGTRVGVIGENRYEWAVAYLAVTGGGAVCVPLDPQLKAKEIGGILETAEAEVVISSPTTLGIFRELGGRLPKLREIISMDDAEEGVRGWADVLAGGDDDAAREEYLGREVSLDDLAVLLFTSGTTGKSKAVMLTQRNLGANVDQVYRALYFDENDVFLSLLPLHHTFEATAGMLIPIAGGCTVTYARSYKSKEIVEDIKDAGVTMMCGVPLLYEKMLAGLRRAVRESPAVKRTLFGVLMAVTRVGHVLFGVNLGRFLFSSLRKKAGLDTVRMFISGAAPLKAEVSRTFYYLGLNLLQGYGLTETSPVVSVNVPERIKFASRQYYGGVLRRPGDDERRFAGRVVLYRRCRLARPRRLRLHHGSNQERDRYGRRQERVPRGDRGRTGRLGGNRGGGGDADARPIFRPGSGGRRDIPRLRVSGRRSVAGGGGVRRRLYREADTRGRGGLLPDVGRL
jgi:long-chain acyl-CoA synthetase